MKVHKKNGVIEDFDLKSIEESIRLSFVETGQDHGSLPAQITSEVEPELLLSGEMISSMQIGDIVGKAIMNHGLYEVLRSYILRNYIL